MSSRTEHPGRTVKPACGQTGRADRVFFLASHTAAAHTPLTGRVRTHGLRAIAAVILLCCAPEASHGQTLARFAQAPEAPPRLGQVATGSAYPSAFQPGDVRVMARTLHIARQPITALQLAFANSYLRAGVGESATGAPATITAAIEYPAGTFTRVRFGGSAAGRIADNGYILSDRTDVAIPRGATFWVRSFYRNPAGFVYLALASAHALPADSFAAGPAQTDQTMGGAISGRGSTIGYFPLAIVAPTRGPSDCLFGDSRVVGIADVRDDASNDGGELARALGPSDAYLMMAVSSGRLLRDGLNLTANRVALARFCTAGVDEYGINDLATGASPDAIVAGRASFAALFPFLPMLGTTLAPVTSSTDHWSTLVHQTLTGLEPERAAFNQAERAVISGEAGVIDISDALDPRRTGLWPVNGTPDWATKDGVHETNVGNGVVIRRSKIWSLVAADRRRMIADPATPHAQVKP